MEMMLPEPLIECRGCSQQQGLQQEGCYFRHHPQLIFLPVIHCLFLGKAFVFTSLLLFTFLIPNFIRTLEGLTGPSNTLGSAFSCSQRKYEHSYIFGLTVIYILTPHSAPPELNRIDSLLLQYNLENNSNNSNICGLAKCFITVNIPYTEENQWLYFICPIKAKYLYNIPH